MSALHELHAHTGARHVKKKSRRIGDMAEDQSCLSDYNANITQVLLLGRRDPKSMG